MKGHTSHHKKQEYQKRIGYLITIFHNHTINSTISSSTKTGKSAVYNRILKLQGIHNKYDQSSDIHIIRALFEN